MVNLTTADVSDSAGAQAILDGIRKRWPSVKHLFADGAYDRLKLMDKASYLDFVIEVMEKGHAHRYQCRGDDAHVGAGLCVGIGGLRIDRAIALACLEAVLDRAVEAAIFASDQLVRSANDIIAAIERDLEAARYEASLAARRYELVDPAKRHVARELEARWNAALERIVELEKRIEDKCAGLAAQPKIDRAMLLQLAQDLPAVWNAPATDTRTKQRLVHTLIKEVVFDLDAKTNEAVLLVHWVGGRHSELRVARVKTGRYPKNNIPTAVEALQTLAGHRPDKELAVSLNRMLCKTGDGETWATVRVREMRERLGLPDYDGKNDNYISLAKAAERFGICIGSARRLAETGLLPCRQIMKGSPWLIPTAALDDENVQIEVQKVNGRMSEFYTNY